MSQITKSAQIARAIEKKVNEQSNLAVELSNAQTSLAVRLAAQIQDVTGVMDATKTLNFAHDMLTDYFGMLEKSAQKSGTTLTTAHPSMMLGLIQKQGDGIIDQIMDGVRRGLATYEGKKRAAVEHEKGISRSYQGETNRKFEVLEPVSTVKSSGWADEFEPK